MSNTNLLLWRNIMESIFETKEQYLQMRANFRSWYNTEDNRKSLTACDFALYALLRRKDWRKCFTSNTSEKTIELIERYLTKTKTQYMFLTPYGDVVTEEMISSLRGLNIPSWRE
jgi:hypothetical protein